MTLLLSQLINDDAGIFSIANDYSSEDNDTFTGEPKEETTLSALRTRRIEQNYVSSAKGFLLARGAVVRFVQDSIAHAVDRQNGTLTRMEEQMFFHVLKAI